MKNNLRFVKDISLNFVSTILLIIALQFLYFPQILKTNNQYIFGDFLLIIAVVNLIAGSVGGAISNFYLKYFSTWSNKQEEEYYKNLLFVSITISILCISIMYLLSGILFGTYLFEKYKYYIFAYMFLSLNKLILTSWFRVRLKYIQILISNLFMIILYLMGWLFLKYTNYQNPFIFLLLAEIVYIYCLSKLSYPNKLYLFSLDYKIIKKLVYPLLIFFMSSIFFVLYKYLDRILLSINGEVSQVPVFYAANIVGLLFAVPFNIISNVLFSYIARKDNFEAKYILRLLVYPFFAFVVAYLLGFYIGPLLIRIMYPTIYNEAMTIFRILNIGNALLVIDFILRSFIIKKYPEKVKMKIDFYSILVYFLISIALIPLYNIYGLALGYSLGIFLKIIVDYILVIKSFLNNRSTK